MFSTRWTPSAVTALALSVAFDRWLRWNGRFQSSRARLVLECRAPSNFKNHTAAHSRLLLPSNHMCPKGLAFPTSLPPSIPQSKRPISPSNMGVNVAVDERTSRRRARRWLSSSTTRTTKQMIICVPRAAACVCTETRPRSSLGDSVPSYL